MRDFASSPFVARIETEKPLIRAKLTSVDRPNRNSILRVIVVSYRGYEVNTKALSPTRRTGKLMAINRANSGNLRNTRYFQLRKGRTGRKPNEKTLKLSF